MCKLENSIRQLNHYIYELKYPPHGGIYYSFKALKHQTPHSWSFKQQNFQPVDPI